MYCLYVYNCNFFLSVPPPQKTEVRSSMLLPPSVIYGVKVADTRTGKKCPITKLKF